MRRLAILSTLLVMLALPAHAQTPRTTPDLAGSTVGAAASPNGNVSAVGRKMPPATGRLPSEATADPKGADKTTAGRVVGGRTVGAKGADAKVSDAKVSDAKAKAATEAEMLKAQKAAEARNKAWDARMRKTMGSICSGC